MREMMRSMEEIYGRLNELLISGGRDDIEHFLSGCMDTAKEEGAYGIYLAVGNELLCFYRETERFDRAFSLAEDLLLLMEEFHLEESESFACVMINTAAAYNGAGLVSEALQFYRRAVLILEQKKEERWLLARVLTEMALTMMKTEEADGAEAHLERAVRLFEEAAERGDAPEKEAEIYYVTALTGLGEAAWKKGENAKALAYYEKAAETGCGGDGPGNEILRENCAILAGLLGDKEKEKYHRSLQKHEEDKT